VDSLGNIFVADSMGHLTCLTPDLLHSGK